MNKENAHLYLPLVQAMADGKTIQVKTTSGNWEDRVNLEFSLDPKYYRIKPEPRTFEMWLTPHGTMYPILGLAPPLYERITVREVLP